MEELKTQNSIASSHRSVWSP